jgi:uncharacterized protein YqhQ
MRVGGMAFGNGVLMRSPHFWAWAREDGTVMHRPVRTLLDRHRALRLPLVRSAVSFGEMVGLMVSLHARNGWRRIVRLLLWMALWLAADLGFSLLLPYLLPDHWTVQEALLGVLDFGLALLAMREGMGAKVWRYHGAEHKAVNAFEAGADLDDLRAVATYSRIHDRCGSNLVVIAGLLLALGYFVVSLPMGGLLGMLVTVVVMIVALELFRQIVRRPRSAISRALLAGGKLLQRYVTTSEPEPEHLRLACAALTRCVELERERDSARLAAAAAPHILPAPGGWSRSVGQRPS